MIVYASSQPMRSVQVPGRLSSKKVDGHDASGTAQSPNNPASDTNFKVDCPAINGQGCRPATTIPDTLTNVAIQNAVLSIEKGCGVQVCFLMIDMNDENSLKIIKYHQDYFFFKVVSRYL